MIEILIDEISEEEQELVIQYTDTKTSFVSQLTANDNQGLVNIASDGSDVLLINKQDSL